MGCLTEASDSAPFTSKPWNTHIERPLFRPLVFKLGYIVFAYDDLLSKIAFQSAFISVQSERINLYKSFGTGK